MIIFICTRMLRISKLFFRVCPLVTKAGKKCVISILLRFILILPFDLSASPPAVLSFLLSTAFFAFLPLYQKSICPSAYDSVRIQVRGRYDDVDISVYADLKCLGCLLWVTWGKSIVSSRVYGERGEGVGTKPFRILIGDGRDSILFSSSTSSPVLPSPSPLPLTRLVVFLLPCLFSSHPP